MKVVQVPKPGADFQLVEREIPEPGPGHVRIRVQACGVCHSDVVTKEGLFPGMSYPRVPGHEVAGVIEYYDQSFIRLTRDGEPNLFIFKHEIKYIQEES